MDEKQAADLLGQFFREVQATAIVLAETLEALNVSTDVANSALAMALAISTKHSGMSGEEAQARFAMSLKHVHKASPTWQ